MRSVSSNLASIVELLVGAVGLQPYLPDSAPVQLATLESHLGGKLATYISTPITTGLSLLRWRAQSRNSSASADVLEVQVKTAVMQENKAALVPLLERVSTQVSGPIINPTELTEPAWKQGDYHRFWVEVIGRCVSSVVLADGWQYSTGCSIEFAAAHLLELPTFDSSLRKLSSDQASHMLKDGAEMVLAAGLDATVIREAALLVS